MRTGKADALVNAATAPERYDQPSPLALPQVGAPKSWAMSIEDLRIQDRNPPTWSYDSAKPPQHVVRPADHLSHVDVARDRLATEPGLLRHK